MNNKTCPSCGGAMKRSGRTGAGAQRWRCRACGASAVHAYDSDLADFNAFLGWLLSKETQRSMPGDGRTFRRRSERFWKVWPMPDVVDEARRVVFVDGICLDRGLCVLIACVSANVNYAIFTNQNQPIAPPQIYRSDQRTFTNSTNGLRRLRFICKASATAEGARTVEKNMIGELNMCKEAGIKPNFSDIARRYGKDWHTVAAYWKADGSDPGDARKDRWSSFEPRLEEVRAKTRLPGVTKKGIYEYLVRRYPGEDLASYNAFTQFMRVNGIAIGPSAGAEPHPRFETPPGLQLRFDWKESMRMADCNGELFEFNVFAATLGWSRRHIFIYSRTRTTDDLVRCMFPTVLRLGGASAEWVTDNMSALVTMQGGRRLRAERVFSFARDAGFEIKMCRRRRPETKGKVESANRFLSRLRLYEGEFEGEDGLVDIIARIEQRCNDEINETTGMPPSALFMQEKDALRPIGNRHLLEEAMGDVANVPKVPSTMIVSAHGAKMSVPRRCIGRPAKVVRMPGGAMDCYMAGELVATHLPGDRVYDPAHYAEAMAGKRWFGDADIDAAAAANLDLLDSIGGSL